MSDLNNILLVDDDKELLQIYEQVFHLNHYKVTTASDGYSALKTIEKSPISVVVADIIMPKMNGLDLLKRIKEFKPQIQVVMLTAEGTISGAVDAVHMGAFTYMVKPADIEELLFNVKRAQEIFTMQEENISLKRQMAEMKAMTPLIGKSNIIHEIRKKINIIACSDASVLITGESGTGKEIVANLIHNTSKRSNKPFVKVNCAALAESILESELFGHEKGAFTGAAQSRQGRFELCHKGTLLLDEIGELPLATQAKLLRVLQEKEFERVGGTHTIKTDFHLIASTNKDLKQEIQKGNFREDLFYRINVVPIYFPPLRERKEDIPLLISYFLDLYSQEIKKTIEPLSKDILEMLIYYQWPGNVRELKNLIERLVVMAQGTKIKTNDVPEEIRRNAIKIPNNHTSLLEARKQFEASYIRLALERNQGNITATSNELQIARKNLYKKIKDYHIG